MELAHMSVESGKSNICKIGRQSGDLGKSDVAVLSLKATERQNSFLFGGPQSVSLKAFN